METTAAASASGERKALCGRALLHLAFELTPPSAIKMDAITPSAEETLFLNSFEATLERVEMDTEVSVFVNVVSLSGENVCSGRVMLASSIRESLLPQVAECLGEAHDAITLLLGDEILNSRMSLASAGVTDGASLNCVVDHSRLPSGVYEGTGTDYSRKVPIPTTIRIVLAADGTFVRTEKLDVRRLGGFQERRRITGTYITTESGMDFTPEGPSVFVEGAFHSSCRPFSMLVVEGTFQCTLGWGSWASILWLKRVEEGPILNEHSIEKCLPGCLNPQNGLHHKKCPNFGSVVAKMAKWEEGPILKPADEEPIW